MLLKELKDYLNSLPEEMDNFSVVNGEYGYLDENDEDSFIYRVDKPVLVCLVEKEGEEVVLLHQTREDLNEYVDLPSRPE